MPTRVFASLALLAFFADCAAKPSFPDGGIVETPMRDMAHGPINLAEPDRALGSNDLRMPPADLAEDDMAAMPPSDLAMPDLGVLDLAPRDFAGADLACANACNAPPAARCQSNVIVTYPMNGSCQNGACVYPPSMQTCMNGCYMAACSMNPLSFCGNTAGYQTGGAAINIGPNNGGTTPANNSVSITVQTFPHGTASLVSLFWATDLMYTNKKTLTMMFDNESGNNDQWYAIIPMQPAGTQVYFNIRADAYGGAASQFSPGKFGDNFTYKSQ